MFFVCFFFGVAGSVDTFFYRVCFFLGTWSFFFIIVVGVFFLVFGFRMRIRM